MVDLYISDAVGYKSLAFGSDSSQLALSVSALDSLASASNFRALGALFLLDDLDPGDGFLLVVFLVVGVVLIVFFPAPLVGVPLRDVGCGFLRWVAIGMTTWSAVEVGADATVGFIMTENPGSVMAFSSLLSSIVIVSLICVGSETLGRSGCFGVSVRLADM